MAFWRRWGGPLSAESVYLFSLFRNLVSERPYCITLASRYAEWIGESAVPSLDDGRSSFQRHFALSGAV